jgi:hypothetical protein
MNNIELNDKVFAALRVRVTRVLPAQIKHCVEQLSEEQLWWRPNSQSNSVGNLHVRGAVLHYLCFKLGGIAYERDRQAEFADQAVISKQLLLEQLAELTVKATQTFETLTPSGLAAASTEPAYYSLVVEDLLGIAIHMATHTGQIVVLTKMLQAGSLDELWMHTHRELGAWKM